MGGDKKIRDRYAGGDGNAGLWKKMTETRRIERKTNEAVLNEINEKRTMMNATTRVKINLNGHRLSVRRHHRGKENER